MKTAISLPDTLFAAAEATARSMGIPRSQLYAQALEEFISRKESKSITEKYNEVYAKPDSNNATALANASLVSLRELTKNDSW